MELAAEILTARDVPRPPRESLARLLNFGRASAVNSIGAARLRIRPTWREMIANFEMLLPGFTKRG